MEHERYSRLVGRMNRHNPPIKNAFVRATHDENNKPRIELEQYEKDVFGLYHWLWKSGPMSFEDIVNTILGDDENFSIKPSQEEICSWLIKEIEYDFIRVVKL